MEQGRGFERAAGAWEGSVLGGRVEQDRPGWLDELWVSGEVGWARLAPRWIGSADADSNTLTSRSEEHT